MPQNACDSQRLRWLTAIGLSAGVLIALSSAQVFAADLAAAEAQTPAGTAVDLPAEVDLRPTLNELGLKPRRQGRRGTCSVFTTAATFEFALSKRRGESLPLSVEYLNWSCNQITHNRRDVGQFFHNLLKGYELHGVCLESEMPYTRRFDPELAPSEEAIKSAKQIRELPFEVHWIKPIGGAAGVTPEQLVEIKRVLASGWPVAAGASHSRLFVGYVDDEKEPGGGAFLTKDSGSGSYSRVTYEFARTHVNDVFWVDLPELADAKKPESGKEEPPKADPST
jgi:hypothetical protein